MKITAGLPLSSESPRSSVVIVRADRGLASRKLDRFDLDLDEAVELASQLLHAVVVARNRGD